MLYWHRRKRHVLVLGTPVPLVSGQLALALPQRSSTHGPAFRVDQAALPSRAFPDSFPVLDGTVVVRLAGPLSHIARQHIAGENVAPSVLRVELTERNAQRGDECCLRSSKN